MRNRNAVNKAMNNATGSDEVRSNQGTTIPDSPASPTPNSPSRGLSPEPHTQQTSTRHTATSTGGPTKTKQEGKLLTRDKATKKTLKEKYAVLKKKVRRVIKEKEEQAKWDARTHKELEAKNSCERIEKNGYIGIVHFMLTIVSSNERQMNSLATLKKLILEENGLLMKGIATYRASEDRPIDISDTEGEE